MAGILTYMCHVDTTNEDSAVSRQCNNASRPLSADGLTNVARRGECRGGKCTGWADIVKAELTLLQPLINTEQQQLVIHLEAATVASANVAATLVAAAAAPAGYAAAAWQTPTQQ